MRYALLFAISAVASFGLTPPIAAFARGVRAVDEPGDRKIHRVPVPRLGGLAVALGGAVAIAVAIALDLLHGVSGPAVLLHAWGPLLAGGFVILTLGAVDDLRPLSPLAKLIVEIGAAVVVWAMGARVETVTLLGRTYELGLLGVPLTICWIVLLTNAFNLVDGLDGLATGLAIIAASTCAIILIARSDVQSGTALVVLVGALCGFLPYNVGPARVFLGDSGSLLVGYALAVTAITGFQKAATSLAVTVPLLIFALPLAETASSTTRRLLQQPGGAGGGSLGDVGRRLRRVVQADSAHFHHRLMQLGLSPRATVLVLYSVAVFLSLLALASARIP